MNTLSRFIFESVTMLDELRMSAQNRRDLDMAITWLRNNDVIKSVGKMQSGKTGRHTITARTKHGKGANARQLVRDRFGTFISVR